MALLVLVWLVGASGCARNGAGPTEAVKRDPNLVVVYAACSLVPMVEAARAQFEAENTGKSVRIQGDEPAGLVRRIEGGEVPDLLVCPGEAEIGVLEREGLLDGSARKAIGSMGLAIAVPAAREEAIRDCKDLASSRVRSITMSLPGITSLGSDGKGALEQAGLWSKIQEKLILHETPLASLKVLAEGSADAGIIYEPCLRLHLGGEEEEIPAGSVEVAFRLDMGEGRAPQVYAVAHKRSPNALLARRFVRVLESEGILPASPEAGTLGGEDAGGGD
jgi:molybdate transport system substrate-binding protein